MKVELVLPGLNIQAPWARLLLSGQKTIETRNYPLPKKHVGQPIAIIETPGKSKPRFTAQVIGVIVFRGSFEYKNQHHWQKDYAHHLVGHGNIDFKFTPGKKKFAWVVDWAEPLINAVSPPKIRGIIFATSCHLPKLGLPSRIIDKIL